MKFTTLVEMGQQFRAGKQQVRPSKAENIVTPCSTCFSLQQSCAREVSFRHHRSLGDGIPKTTLTSDFSAESRDDIIQVEVALLVCVNLG